MSGKLAVIIFGLCPIALLLWAVGVSGEIITMLILIAALLIIFSGSQDTKNSD